MAATFISSGLDMIGRENFKAGVTLSQDQFLRAVYGMIGVLLFVAFLAVSLKMKERKMAWMVSLVNSFIMTLAGVFYLAMKLPDLVNPISQGNFRVGHTIFHEPVSNFTAIMCLWFLVANVFDLMFGLLFYRNQLGFLTAYVHHSIFIWTMVCATTGNGGFLTTKPFPSAFAYVVIEELPTFLLALGSVVPACRTDMGFGLTFFTFRICYHFFFFTLACYNSETVGMPVRVLYSLTLLMHINWFYAWVTKYLFPPKLRLSPSKDKLRAYNDIYESTNKLADSTNNKLA